MNNKNIKNDSLNSTDESSLNTENISEEGTVGKEIYKSEHNEEENGEPKKRKKLDIFPKIVCVFFAILIWYYVMQVESPEYEASFSDVPVVLTSTAVLENERSLYVYSGHEYTVDVTVNGKKSVISQYTVDDIKVTADLKDILNAGEHDVKLNVKLPTGLTLINTDYEHIPVYVDEKASVSIPIKAKLTGANFKNGYEYGELVTEYNSVIVTGPKTSLSSIGYAMATVDLSGPDVIVETWSGIRAISLYGKNGEEISNPYIKLSRNEVSVTLPVYTERLVDLGVEYVNGLFNDKNVDVKIEPNVLRIKGDPAVLSQVNKIIVATLDEKQVEDNVTYTFELEESEKYTYLSNSTISVTVKHKNTVTKTYSVDNIVVNAGDNEYRTLTKSLDVTLRGPANQLEEITAEDIKIKADISGYSTDYTGTVNVEVEIEITVEGATEVYEVGTYRVQIRVND